MINAVNEFLDDLRGGRMSEAPVVKVEQGQLQGRIATTPSGQAYHSFQGIPYAKPPLGSLRFKGPEPAEPWEGIRDATAEGNITAQHDVFTQQYAGDENCLFLNVYTPNVDSTNLPVMVWIHGGGLRFGSGNTNMYGPDYLVEKEVILVTLNYRCGPLGFLSLNTPEVPGNAGVKDVVQALRWLNENIKSFGGDPKNLTVFGESAGGGVVSLLTASPLSKRLISRAIVQSGVGLCSWMTQRNPLENARKLVKILGSDATEPDDILEFLNATTARDIVEGYDKLCPMADFGSSQFTFSVVVEKEFPGVEAFFTEDFIDYLTSGRIADIPIMTGKNTLEFALNVEDLEWLIPHELNIAKGSEESKNVVAELEKLYSINPANKLGVYNLVSDRFINMDTYRFIQYLIKVSSKPIYFYNFDYDGGLNIAKKLPFGALGADTGLAMHMDELPYLFRNDLQEGVEPSDLDIKIRERMLRLWTNFAKCGNPTPDKNHYLNVTWEPVTEDTFNCLQINKELTIITNPQKEKLDYWNNLYNKHYKIWNQIAEPETPEKQPEIEIPAPEIVDSVQIVEEIPISTPEVQIVDEIPTQEVKPEEELIKIEDNNVEEVRTYTENITITSSSISESVVETNEVITTEDRDIEPLKNGISENGVDKKPRLSNEIKMYGNGTNGAPKDVIRANDPPEDDLPKNIGVNKFVNFFESLGGKK